MLSCYLIPLRPLARLDTTPRIMRTLMKMDLDTSVACSLCLPLSDNAPRQSSNLAALTYTRSLACCPLYMSNLYATKSLGRIWIPPSSPGGSPIVQSNKTARSPFLESQPFRWPSTREQMAFCPGSWKSPSAGSWPFSKWRWSRAHERVILAASLILLAWWFCLREESYFRRNVEARIGFERYLYWTKDAEVELQLKNVTWRDFAYVTYATNLDYLCNSVMMVEALNRLDAKAQRVILHSEEWSTDSRTFLENGTDVPTTAAKLLQQAKAYNAVLQPIPIQRVGEDVTWGDSFTKLLAFNQTQYRRVLALDSDSTILQPMDELFLLPSTPVAMPRAYWLEHELFDAITLITPSSASAARIQTAISHREETDFDMDIINDVFGDSCMVLPHRGYALISGEFRKLEVGQHVAYLGEEDEEWDAEKVVEEAKFVHFSDWPLPKPWMASDRKTKDETRPKCLREGSMEEDCRDQKVWDGLYGDFRERRKVCDWIMGMGFLLTLSLSLIGDMWPRAGVLGK